MAEDWEIRAKKLDDGWLVTLSDPRRHGHTVLVELSELRAGLEPRALTIQRGPESLSGRDVRRLPLDSYFKAAASAVRLALAELLVRDVVAPKGTSRAEKERMLGIRPVRLQKKALQLLLPKGRPERGHSTGFYREILESAERIAAQGKSPARVIARRKGVSENTVRQWLFRARQGEQKGRGKR